MNVPIIATSDFSHFVPRQKAVKDDSLLLEKIMKSSPKDFLDTVKKNQTSICGAFTIATLMYAMKGKESDLLTYYTSGDITGDNSSVVGYASLGFR